MTASAIASRPIAIAPIAETAIAIGAMADGPRTRGPTTIAPVTLAWNVRTNAVSVSVVDEQDDAAFQFQVAPADALDAFHHPYAYAPQRHEEEALAA
jgi:hypothetical protein